MDRTCSQRYHEITLAHSLAQNLRPILERADVLGVFVSVALDSIRQYLCIDSVDRRFARAVNVSHQQHIGVIESTGELVHQIIRPRVAMRLEENDDATVRRADSRGA